ncbi:MAG: ABC transporter ATP-binding protein [SAR324 cluster bacterium]|nr:ABC transporter ATP-binding protein [SAR324 cluster bacterium]
MENRIFIKNIDAGYGSVKVLHDVSIEMTEGETVILLGTNGNGKSTLIKTIMGIVPPNQGEIIFESEGVQINLVGKKPQEIVNMGITMVPEGRRLFPQLTVEENLYLGAFRREARQNLERNLSYCFEVFPRLGERRTQLAGSMSGGEQQMLALARAIMSSPKILLIDEPSVGLAPILVSQLMTSIKEMKENLNLTVLMTEQNFSQATKIADRGYIIVHGKIEFRGSNVELSGNELVKQYYLGT